jgi:hypothetical protein
MADEKQANLKEPSNSPVHMPKPEARANPCDMDVQEGCERMQGETHGRQNPRDDRRDKKS